MEWWSARTTIGRAEMLFSDPEVSWRQLNDLIEKDVGHFVRRKKSKADTTPQERQPYDIRPGHKVHFTPLSQRSLEAFEMPCPTCQQPRGNRLSSI